MIQTNKKADQDQSHQGQGHQEEMIEIDRSIEAKDINLDHDLHQSITRDHQRDITDLERDQVIEIKEDLRDHKAKKVKI